MCRGDFSREQRPRTTLPGCHGVLLQPHSGIPTHAFNISIPRNALLCTRTVYGCGDSGKKYQIYSCCPGRYPCMGVLCLRDATYSTTAPSQNQPFSLTNVSWLLGTRNDTIGKQISIKFLVCKWLTTPALLFCN